METLQSLIERVRTEYPQDVRTEADSILKDQTSIFGPQTEAEAIATAEGVTVARRYPAEWAALEQAEKAAADYDNNESWR